MINVTIIETNGLRKWSHSARTKDALTAIIRTMNRHLPQSHNFIPDVVDNAHIDADLTSPSILQRWPGKTHYFTATLSSRCHV